MLIRVSREWSIVNEQWAMKYLEWRIWLKSQINPDKEQTEKIEI